jgi:hypothetical protein
VRERDLESYLARRARELGGRAYKWVSPACPGVPDRLLLLAGRVLGVEVKAPGRTPTPHQTRTHQELRALGLPVAVVDTREGIDALLARVLTGEAA